ncbi:hypothetical protein CHUAL_009023 [Chamberlinius hualienensis]
MKVNSFFKECIAALRDNFLHVSQIWSYFSKLLCTYFPVVHRQCQSNHVMWWTQELSEQINKLVGMSHGDTTGVLSCKSYNYLNEKKKYESLINTRRTKCVN